MNIHATREEFAVELVKCVWRGVDASNEMNMRLVLQPPAAFLPACLPDAGFSCQNTCSVSSTILSIAFNRMKHK